MVGGRAVSNRVITFIFLLLVFANLKPDNTALANKSLNVPNAFAIAYTLPEGEIEI